MDPDFDQDEELSFFQQHRIAVIAVGVLVVGGVIFGIKTLSSGSSSAPKTERITMIAMAPPPPPPPPPPPKVEPPPPQQEQKMMEQTPVNEPENKPEPPKADAPAPATGIVGNGPSDGFGLGGPGSGNWLGKGGPGGGSRSRYGWYAGQVQSKVQEQLRSNRKTRSANMQIEVRIWADTTGRVNRARLARSTGDANLDDAIQNEVLTGLQLQEPPPQGMPMPIVMRLTARRPH